MFQFMRNLTDSLSSNKLSFFQFVLYVTCAIVLASIFAVSAWNIHAMSLTTSYDPKMLATCFEICFICGVLLFSCMADKVVPTLVLVLANQSILQQISQVFGIEVDSIKKVSATGPSVTFKVTTSNAGSPCACSTLVSVCFDQKGLFCWKFQTVDSDGSILDSSEYATDYFNVGNCTLVV